jgi:hypothetical protein
MTIQVRSSQALPSHPGGLSGCGGDEAATLEALRAGLKFRKDLVTALLNGIRQVA